jgi:hypothetical protein
VATVVQPLKKLYGNLLDVAPYAVLIKPVQALSLLEGDNDSSPSSGAAYIFHKQLEEADAIAINRVDELKPGELERLSDLVTERFPGAPQLHMSAKTGAGFDSLTAFLAMHGDFGRNILEIDYDTYAAGEAELGWLNAGVQVNAAKEFNLDRLLLDILARLRDAMQRLNYDVAHLKVIGQLSSAFAVANLIGNRLEPELSMPSQKSATEATVIVNARIAGDPDVIEQQVRRIVNEVCNERSAQVEIRAMQSFRPGRPQPTHRYALIN